MRGLLGKVHAEVDTNAYSVAWRLVGEVVEVTISGCWISVFHAGQLVACHAEAQGRHRRLTDHGHFAGITGFGMPARQIEQARPLSSCPNFFGRWRNMSC